MFFFNLVIVFSCDRVLLFGFFLIYMMYENVYFVLEFLIKFILIMIIVRELIFKDFYV